MTSFLAAAMLMLFGAIWGVEGGVPCSSVKADAAMRRVDTTVPAFFSVSGEMTDRCSSDGGAGGGGGCCEYGCDGCSSGWSDGALGGRRSPTTEEDGTGAGGPATEPDEAADGGDLPAEEPEGGPSSSDATRDGTEGTPLLPPSADPGTTRPSGLAGLEFFRNASPCAAFSMLSGLVAPPGPAGPLGVGGWGC